MFLHVSILLWIKWFPMYPNLCIQFSFQSQNSGRLNKCLKIWIPLVSDIKSIQCSANKSIQCISWHFPRKGKTKIRIHPLVQIQYRMLKKFYSCEWLFLYKHSLVLSYAFFHQMQSLRIERSHWFTQWKLLYQ